MERFGKTVLEDEGELYQVVLQLKTIEECRIFFRDLCTPSEVKALSERWKLAKLLDDEEEDLSYREISAKTGASIATIGRVARFLNLENNKGYRLILDRIKSAKREK